MESTMDAKDYSKMSHAELLAEVKRLEQEKATKSAKNLWFKVGEKGGVMEGGLGAFPVTLYYEQWMRLRARLDGPNGLWAFLEEHKQELSMKSTSKSNGALSAEQDAAAQVNA
jgi:hypothetical protein